MIPNDNPLPDLLSGLVPDRVNAAGEGPQDQEQEEEEEERFLPLPLQQVGAVCPGCGHWVNRIVVSTPEGLRRLRLLLLTDLLQLVCNSCVRRSWVLARRHNGR